VFNLLTSPTASRLRGLAGTISDAVRSITNPAALVQAQQPTEQPAVVETPAPAADPVDLYTADEMPELVAIERAALGYDLATDNARRADRAKRAAKKLLTRLPSGTYGAWRISRKPSARQTVDLDAVTAFYRQHGKTVPMKPCADSLVVERTALPAQLVEAAA
jgi:hypothetical protein